MGKAAWRGCLPCCLMAALLFAAPDEGGGCMCSPPPPTVISVRDVAQWYSQRSQFIFEGQVIRQEVESGSIGVPPTAMSYTPNGAHRVVTVLATHVYRGPSRDTFTVLTGMGMGDCGYDFEVGNRYLVYADPVGENKVFTSICTGTAPLELSGPALRLLRSEPPSPDDLLTVADYMKQMVPQWTGTVCGRVVGPSGNPLEEALVTLWQVRADPLPPYRDANNGTAADGTFCAKGIPPGKYLLTAEKDDLHAGTRLMGFYPGVWKHADATSIEVKAGTTQNGFQFGTRNEAMYTVRFRILPGLGSPVNWRDWGIAVDSPDRDPLSYHISHGVENDGSYTFGGIPAGRYTVSGYSGRMRRTTQVVDIVGPTEVVLKLPTRAWHWYWIVGGLLLAALAITGITVRNARVSRSKVAQT